MNSIPQIMPPGCCAPPRTSIASLLCIWVTLSAVGCGPGGEQKARKEKPPVPTIEAAVTTVEVKPWPKIVRSQGSLVADDVSVIGTRVEGRVAAVHVDLGDAVEAGQELVTLRQEPFQLEVEQAQAQLLQARSAIGLSADDPLEKLIPESSPPVREQKAQWDEAVSNLSRARRLLEQKTISTADFNQYEAATKVAQARYDSALNSVREKIALVKVRAAELALAQQDLEDTVIHAPFDGFVQRKEVSPGSYVRAGEPLVTVVRTNPLRFRGMIPERYSLALTEGQEVQLDVESVHSPITVTINRISPALDPLSRSLMFEAEVDNSSGQLRTGLFAEAEIVIDPETTAIVIPHSALVEFAGAEKVWKVVDGQSREQPVLAGDRRAAGIEILQGLSAGDVILVNGVKGRPAKIEPPASSSSSESQTADRKVSDTKRNSAEGESD